MNSDDRIAKAAGLLLHSPPGEVDDVFNDIRGIVNDDEALQEKIEPVLAESNMQQFLVVEVPDKEGSKVLLTPYNQVDGGRFHDPNTNMVFAFDHLRRVAYDPEETAETGEHTELRARLQRSLEQYVEAHFAEGFVSVFEHEGSVVSCLVSNKYSPANFWNGSWRAVWSYDVAKGQLNGSVKVRVHYFEDGNVQLDTQSDFTSDVGENEVAEAIKKFEAEFQQGVNDGFRQLSERTFKGLRRALPVTRNRIDWEKIANYKIGGELANAE